MTKSVGQYFTSTGSLVPERLKKDVDALVEVALRRAKATRKAADAAAAAAAATAAK